MKIELKIETKRLKLRPFLKKDVSEMHELFILPEPMRMVGMYPPFTTIKESRDRIERWMEHGIHYAILQKNGEKIIGYIAIKPDSEEKREDTRELGFALKPKYQQHGYMAEIIEAVLKELKLQGIRYVWACCFRENVNSKKLIEKCGFTFQKEGTYFAEKENRTYDSLEYRKDLNFEA